MMRRILAMVTALGLTLCVAGSAFAQGIGPGYTRSGTGYGTTGATTMGQTGTAAMGQTGYGRGTMQTGQTGYGTGTTGMGMTTGVQGSMRTGQTSGTSYSPAVRPSVVPSGAIEMGRTAMGASTMVSYRMGSMWYRVTYAPNGSYTYTVSGTPSTTGFTTGTTVTSRGVGGTTGYSASLAGGATMLPKTGGGSSPSLPLPVLIGFALLGLGAFTRRMASAAR